MGFICLHMQRRIHQLSGFILLVGIYYLLLVHLVKGEPVLASKTNFHACCRLENDTLSIAHVRVSAFFILLHLLSEDKIVKVIFRATLATAVEHFKNHAY